jgi:hypothetical protein
MLMYRKETAAKVLSILLSILRHESIIDIDTSKLLLIVSMSIFDIHNPAFHPLLCDWYNVYMCLKLTKVWCDTVRFLGNRKLIVLHMVSGWWAALCLELHYSFYFAIQILGAYIQIVITYSVPSTLPSACIRCTSSTVVAAIPISSEGIEMSLSNCFFTSNHQQMKSTLQWPS